MSSNPQSSSPSPLVWFQLLDAATGKSYKNTPVSSILRSSLVVPVVDQFRDAVQLKYDKPKYLKDIPSGALLVYTNKAAFDKRNAVVDEGKEEPLKSSRTVVGLGETEEQAIIVVVPSPFSSPELDQLAQEIMALENSEKFKTLEHKNRAWAVPKPTEQEKGEWQLLKEKLADLKKKEDFYRKADLSTNAHSVKKSDKTRKGYKKDAAIKDERLLLSDVAITMWERFGFTLQRYGKPTFGDFQWAAGFKDDDDVRDYFRKKSKGEVQEDKIKESFTKEAWIWLIGLNQRINPLLHDKLTTNQDGSLRLVLEHDVYEDGIGMAQYVIRILYGSSKKVDIKSDSSTSP